MLIDYYNYNIFSGSSCIVVQVSIIFEKLNIICEINKIKSTY